MVEKYTKGKSSRVARILSTNEACEHVLRLIEYREAPFVIFAFVSLYDDEFGIDTTSDGNVTEAHIITLLLHLASQSSKDMIRVLHDYIHEGCPPLY
jgi:hypothetical protein